MQTAISVLCSKSIWYRPKPGSLKDTEINSRMFDHLQVCSSLCRFLLFSQYLQFEIDFPNIMAESKQRVQSTISVHKTSNLVHIYFYSNFFVNTRKLQKISLDFFLIDSLVCVSEIKELPLTSTFFSVE